MMISRISRYKNLNIIKKLRLYIFYNEEIPSPITVPFDKDFSFKIKKICNWEKIAWKCLATRQW